ncbi:unnamed protein product [Rhodiola kirilowii]
MTEIPAVEAYGRRNHHSEIQMTKMDDLPQDMIAEILRKLRVKTLLRFKTVCKSWLALISTPQFEKLRREVPSHCTGFSIGCIFTFKIYPTCGLLMLRNLMQPILPDELRPLLGLTKCRSELYGHQKTELYGPYNGVYLVRDCHGNTALWNHANMSYKILSQGNSCETDPEEGVTYGFGYEDLLEGGFDFLVMKLHRQGSVSETKAPKLYRLSTGQWKDLKKPLPKEYNCRRISYRTVSINGIFYWLGYGYGEVPKFIILFDTRSETFGKLDLPHIHQQIEDPRLLLSCYRSSDGNELLPFLLVIAAQNYEIWVLRDHKSWVKESTCKSPIKESGERKAPNANDEWFRTFLCDESLVSLGCKPSRFL